MDKVRFHYKTKESYKEFVDKLKEVITDENYIVCNIGTDRCIGDSIGPMTGTILQENNFILKVFGTISEPMHALNLEKRYLSIKESYPNSKIMGIDACLGDINDIGCIELRHSPIRPGRGVGKELIDIGEWSIIGIVDDNSSNEIFTNRNIRLDLIYGMSKVISEALIEATQSIHKKRGRRKKVEVKLVSKEVAIN